MTTDQLMLNLDDIDEYEAMALALYVVQQHWDHEPDLNIQADLELLEFHANCKLLAREALLVGSDCDYGRPAKWEDEALNYYIKRRLNINYSAELGEVIIDRYVRELSSEIHRVMDVVGMPR